MTDNFSELDDCISDVLKKFQLVSGLQFKLRQEQVIAVKTLLFKLCGNASLQGRR